MQQGLHHAPRGLGSSGVAKGAEKQGPCSPGLPRAPQARLCLPAPAHHVLHRRYNLGEDEFAFRLREFPFRVDLSKELPAPCVLHHQVELGQSLHDFVKADDVGMVQFFHAGDFAG